jgi:hypothetical protein
VFIRCELSFVDASFAKYPRLPVMECMGYEAVEEDVETTEEGSNG